MALRGSELSLYFKYVSPLAMLSKLDNGGWSNITPDDYRALINECFHLNTVANIKEEHIARLQQILDEDEAEAEAEADAT